MEERKKTEKQFHNALRDVGLPEGEHGAEILMTVSKKIAGNTGHLLFAYVGRKILAFVFVVLLARYAGVSVTGLFFLVVGYASLLFPLIDFGLSSVLVREGAKRNDLLPVYLGTVLALKALLAAAGLLLGAAVLHQLDCQ